MMTSPLPLDDSEPVLKFIAMGTGTRYKVLHKEELGVSEVEKRTKQRVEENARLAQSRKKGGVATTARKESSGSPTSASQSSTGPVSHASLGVANAAPAGTTAAGGKCVSV